MSTHTAATPLAFPRQVLAVGAHAGAHRVALRAAVSIGVPLVAVWALGHVEWSLYAAFGAFTSLYGRNDAHLDRTRMQATAGLALVAAVVIGALVALSPERGWIMVPVAAVWASATAFLSDALHWHPPGPLFFVFALCAVASVPSTGSSVLVAALVSGASAAFALLVGIAGSLRRPASLRQRMRVDASWSLRSGARERWRGALTAPGQPVAIARFAVAALLAGGLSSALGIGHPYWAIVASVVPLAASGTSGSAVRATHRVLGTAAGLLLAWGLLALHLEGLAAIVVVAALQFAAELFVLRNYALALVFVTPLALTMVELAAPVPTGQLILDRGIETLLGTAIGFAVALALRPRPDRPPRGK